MVTVIKKEKKAKKLNHEEKRLYVKTDSNAGRKSKFDEVNEEIIRRVSQGLSRKDRIAGLINDTTYQEWTRAGEADIQEDVETRFSRFSLRIKSAEKEFRQSLLELIKLQAPQDWKAAVWILERSDPDTYNLKTKVETKQEIEISQKAILEIPDNGDR